VNRVQNLCVSHPSPEYDAVHGGALERLRATLEVPDAFDVLCATHVVFRLVSPEVDGRFLAGRERLGW
jgi:hypothetical protein